MSARAEKAAPLQPPSLLMGGLHLAALWTLAIVQPLLNLLGNNPDFFVARDNTGGEILTFVLLLTVLPGVAATLIELLIDRINPTARWIFHLLLCGLLFSAISLQLLGSFTDGPGWLLIAGCLIPGGLLTWAYARARFMRSMADILIIAPPVVLISFIFFSDASKLITSPSEVPAKEVSASNPAPVVMVILDEFPAGSLMTPSGRINPKRFPNFSDLERTSTWYRNTVTDASYTAIAVPSILTGQDADRDGLPTAADHPDSIFTLLGGNWQTRAIEPITQLCPEGICGVREEENGSMGDALSSLASDLKAVSAHLLLPESMGDNLPDISQTFQGFGDEQKDSVERGRARQWVRDRLDTGAHELDGEGDVTRFISRMGKEGNTFDFVHVEEPHYPWTHYPSGLSYTEGTEDFRSFIVDTDWEAPPYLTDRAQQAHLLEVGFTDQLIGRIIGDLKERGRWDETLFVVTSDHGAAWNSGARRREATRETLGQIAMVPLFIKAPGQAAGRVVDRPTCTTEIVPEMARILGIDLPWEAATCDHDTVSLDNGTGPMITGSFAETIAQRQVYVDRIGRLLGGDGADWDRAFQWGRHKELIGRPVASLPDAGQGESIEVTPETSAPAVSEFDPDVQMNPVLRQRGTITGLGDGVPLAVSVGGRIAAVGLTYPDRGNTMYSILLPQSSLRRGLNEIGLFEVTGPGLRQLWSSSDQ